MLHTYRALATPHADHGLTFHVGYDEEDDGDASFLSYADLRRALLAARQGLADAGVDRDTRVIFSFETSAASVVTFLALLAVGALPLSIRPGTGAAHRDFVAEVARRYRATHIVGVTEATAGALDLRLVELAAITVDGADGPLPEHDPERLAFVQFSSGSTSFPKGVPVTHGALARNLQMIVDADRRNSDDRGSSWLPLYHDMGLVGSLLTSLYAGTDLHLARPNDYLLGPVDWLRHLSRIGATMAVIPNFAIDYVLRYLGDDAALEGIDLRALRCIYLGSEPIHIDNLAAFERRLAPRGLRAGAVKPCYGMAEAVVMVSATPLAEGYRVVDRPGGTRAISVGRVHPDFEIRVIGEDGRPCGDGEAGEIELRGGTLVGAYFEDARPFAGADGYYATGDVGFVDGGELFISGRAGDRFKINAQSFFSSDFEQVTETLDFVRPQRSAVIQCEGRVVVLAEVRREAIADPTPHQEAIVAAIRERLGVKVEVDDVRFIRPGQLPRTSSGKLRRQTIAAAYAAGGIRSAI